MAEFVIMEGPKCGQNLKIQRFCYVCSDNNQHIYTSATHNPEAYFSVIYKDSRYAILWQRDCPELIVQCIDKYRLQHGDVVYIKDIGIMFSRAAKTEKRRHSPDSTKKTLLNIQSRVLLTNQNAILPRLEKSENNLRILYRVSCLINETLQEQELLNKVTSYIAKELNADRAFVLLKTTTGEYQTVVSCYLNQLVGKKEVSRTIINEVIQSQSAFFSQDTKSDERLKTSETIKEQRISCVLCAPIVIDSVIQGILYLDSVSIRPVFSSKDLELLTGISMQLGLAIDRLRLHQISLEKQRIEKAIGSAQEVQKLLLPENTPDYMGISMHIHHTPFHGLGGDYYDYFDLDIHRTAFIIADITGKDIASALLMTMTRSILRSLCRQETSPAVILEKANEILKEDIPQEMFVTAFLGIIDHCDLSFIYSGAGHNFPIFANSSHHISELECGGLPLGLIEDTSFEEGKLQLQKGDMIFLYTDGLVESKNASGHMFGKKRIQKTIEEYITTNSGGNLSEYTYQKFLYFLGSQKIQDDTTVFSLVIGEGQKKIWEGLFNDIKDDFRNFLLLQNTPEPKVNVIVTIISKTLSKDQKTQIFFQGNHQKVRIQWKISTKQIAKPKVPDFIRLQFSRKISSFSLEIMK